MGQLLAAAGGGDTGLETLLARMREEEMLGQHQQALNETNRSNVAREAYQNRALDLNSQLRADAEKDRQASQIDKTVSMRGIGDPVSESEYARETGAGGVPGGDYAITPAKAPTSTIGFSSLPNVQPQNRVQPSGTIVPQPNQGDAMTGATSARVSDPTSSMTAPRTIAFRGTGAQRQAATKESDTVAAKTAAAQQALTMAQEKANEAWERLRLQGESNNNLAAFQESRLELERTRNELAKSRQEAADAGSQPFTTTDRDGNWHALKYDKAKGTLTEIPMPPGFVPHKAAPVGIFDRLSQWMHGGSDGSSTNDDLKNILNSRGGSGGPQQ